MHQDCKVYLTARDRSDRIALQPVIPWSRIEEKGHHSIVIRDSIEFQSIEGFGGAFTESAATVLQKMPASLQEEILNAYFHPTQGNGYTLCRTHINSCDFSLGNWACDEMDGDVDLKHFNVKRDEQAIIPMIQRAAAIAGRPIQIFASPWSPPAWMKTNGQMNQGGKLREEYRAAWATYYCRYVQEYENRGIPIWGLTVQNEPAAVQPLGFVHLHIRRRARFCARLSWSDAEARETRSACA